MEPAFSGRPEPKKDPAPLTRTRTSGNSPEKTQVFNRQYMATAKIQSTASYDLYLGVVMATKQQIALKIEKTSSRTQILFNEARTLGALRGKEDEGVRGIPKLYWFGTEEDSNVLALELTGPSLKILQKTRNRGFSLKTVLMLADQMIKRVEYIHTRGYLHRDIRPSCFAVGLLEHSNTVYLTNFEYSKLYKSNKNNQHKPYAENKEVIGNATYCSISCHLGIEPSRRDDLESLGYTLVYLYKGSLPWNGIEGSTVREKVARTMDKKMALPSEALCKGMPDAFSAYLNYCKSLKYDEKPDYKYLRELFRKVMSEKEFIYDNYFDWVANQQTSPENLTYDFGNLSISFKANTQADFSALGLSQALSNKSKLLPPSRNETDPFSQEEQETSNILPIDLSIGTGHSERPFPSKVVMMPTSLGSPFESMRQPISQGGVKKSLTSIDDKAIEPREDFLSKDFLALKRNVKTNEILSLDEEDLKYKHLGTASTMNKTVSMRVPDNENTKSRIAVQNVLFEEEHEKEDSDIEEHEPVSSQISKRINPVIKTFEKLLTFDPKDKEEAEFHKKKSTVNPEKKKDIEEHKLSPKGKTPEQNECAMF